MDRVEVSTAPSAYVEPARARVRVARRQRPYRAALSERTSLANCALAPQRTSALAHNRPSCASMIERQIAGRTERRQHLGRVERVE